MKEKLKKYLVMSIQVFGIYLAVILVVGLVVGLMCLTPLVVLWGFNTLAEMSGSDLYIPHTFWSYVAIIAISGIFGSRGSRK